MNSKRAALRVPLLVFENLIGSFQAANGGQIRGGRFDELIFKREYNCRVDSNLLVT